MKLQSPCVALFLKYENDHHTKHYLKNIKTIKKDASPTKCWGLKPNSRSDCCDALACIED